MRRRVRKGEKKAGALRCHVKKIASGVRVEGRESAGKRGKREEGYHRV